MTTTRNEGWEKEIIPEYSGIAVLNEDLVDAYEMVKAVPFINQLIDAEIAEAVKAEREWIREVVGTVDEEFLAQPDCEHYPAEWAINKDRQRILEALTPLPASEKHHE